MNSLIFNVNLSSGQTNSSTKLSSWNKVELQLALKKGKLLHLVFWEIGL